ncbi:MAG: calcium-binding protein [Chloroflexi bacterium]|nr:MAG: calcium-binding protein [Chloroflexota bacterium]
MHKGVLSMLKSKTLIVLALLGLLLTFAFAAVLAQDDGGMSDDYNWCSDPNYWGDGRCENTEDEDLRTCLWEMGWYLPRVEAGEYTIEQVAAVSGCVHLSPEPVAGAINIPVCDDGYYIVVLVGSPYTGSDADEVVNSNNFTAASSYNCHLIIHGNNNDNTITGSAGDDQIYGYDGNDTIYGDSYSDAGSGNDTIDGGAGGDYIYGDSYNGDGSGDDTIYGGDELDYIYGDSYNGDGSGDDTIYGGNGDDKITGDSWIGNGSGNDALYGEAGNDFITGDSYNGNGSGNDVIDSGSDWDAVYGDTPFGTATGSDSCYSYEFGGNCNP